MKKNKALPEESVVEEPAAIAPAEGKRVRKGSFYCFVIMFLIAASVAVTMGCSFSLKEMTDMTAVINIVSVFPQLLAYFLIANQARLWVSHRGRGVKVAFWATVAIVFVCLLVQLGLDIWHLVDNGGANNSEAGQTAARLIFGL